MTREAAIKPAAHDLAEPNPGNRNDRISPQSSQRYFGNRRVG
ncbi:hypothetical protein [Mesorhizobium sp. RMAD-H1]|nr:hypothetical protein [Mesorhizobium sp. RMAD-H1]MBB2971782.1 hypothetical protein [Mesorhizobium sp. RMAD-H1]